MLHILAYGSLVVTVVSFDVLRPGLQVYIMRWLCSTSAQALVGAKLKIFAQALTRLP